MPLEPLPEAAMRQLLGGLAPGLPEQAVTAILSRADGIPLYAVETIRMLVADGRLTLTDGAYTPTGDLGELAVPETLRSLIASRLDALDPTDRTLLQDGAVLGQRFTTAALAATSGMTAEEIEPRLRALVRREFLELEADPRSPERGQYGFVQSLIREVAYGTLARRDRRSRHLAAARYFEMLSDDELAGVLASHYLAAHEASEAGPEADALAVQARLALRGAAERAAALGGHAQALVYLEQALAVSTDPGERATLLHLASESANASGHDAKAQDYARQVIDYHASVGDEASRMRAVGLLGRVLLDNGHLDEAVEFMEGELSGEVSDSPDSAQVLANLSRAYMRTDKNQDSVDAADRALKIADRLNMERVVAEAFINKASSLHRLGRIREAVALHQAALAIADRHGFAEQQLRGRNNYSVSQIELEPTKALQTIHEAIDLARRLGQRGMYNWLIGTGAMYSASIGTGWERALELEQEVLASSPIPYDRARALLTSSLLHARRGDPIDMALLREATAGITDGQVVGGFDFVQAEVALTENRWADAHSLSFRALTEWVDSTGLVMQPALHAAAVTKRAGDAQEIKARMDAHASGTPTADAMRAWTDGVVDALTGSAAEALREIRMAYEATISLGFAFDAATIVIDALRLFPDEAEVHAWVPAARAILEELRAKPYLRMLDEALQAAGQPTRPGVRPAGRPVEAGVESPAS
jgi:tetratricopeptide (TPR) repeat protein